MLWSDIPSLHVQSSLTHAPHTTHTPDSTQALTTGKIRIIAQVRHRCQDAELRHIIAMKAHCNEFNERYVEGIKESQ